MPVAPLPTLEPNEGDGGKRVSFVLWLQGTLECLAAEDRYRPLFIDGLGDAMSAAWRDTAEVLPQVARAIRDLPQEQERRHGLAGNQLDFKLATVRHWASSFHERDGRVQSYEEVPARIRRLSRHLLKRLLDAINTLLKSILDALGLGSSVKELKDAIKDAIDFIAEP